MPYKSERIKIQGSLLDRRRRLTEEQKEEITGISQRELARIFKVERTTIRIIVDPERLAVVKDRIKQHWRDYRGSKEKRARAVRETRRYKNKLYLDGKIKMEEK